MRTRQALGPLIGASSVCSDFILPELDRTIPSPVITGTGTKNLRLIACITQGIDKVMRSLLIGIREEEEIWPLGQSIQGTLRKRKWAQTMSEVGYDLIAIA